MSLPDRRPPTNRLPAWVPMGLVALLLTLASSAWAQAPLPLERIAPPDAILALGLTPDDLPQGDLLDALELLDGEAAEAAFAKLAAVFEEIDGVPMPMGPGMGGMGGLGFMLNDMLDDGADLGGEFSSEMQEACPALESQATALLERDDWADDLLLTVAWDPFSSIPGALALARVEAGAVDAAQALHAQLVECFGGEPLGTAEGVTLNLLGDGGDLPLVVAVLDDLFLVGTQPEPVRAALARASGSGDVSLADRPGAWTDAPTGARLYYDLARLADVVESLVPIAPDDPMASAVDRGLAVLRTVGSGTARLSLSDAGIETEVRGYPDAAGGDAVLYDLLTCASCTAPDASWAAAGALSAQGMAFDLQGWVGWLDGLVAEVSGAAMGAPMTLRDLLLEEVGVDLDLLLLDWIGGSAVTSQMATISTDLRDLLSAPAISIVEVQSNAAAEAGLEAIEAAIDDLRNLAAEADGDLADLQGVVDQIAIRHAETMGVSYRRVQISATTDLRIAVGFDRLVMATSEEAFESALALVDGSGPNGLDSAGWAAVEAASSGTVSAWRYGDGGAPLRGIADLLELAAQPAAAGLAAAAQAALDEADEMASFGEAAPMESAEPVVDLANRTGYAGPPGIADADATDVALGAPVQGTIDDTTPRFDGGFDAIDLWRLPPIPAGTEVSVVMTSTPLDTYLNLYDAATGEVLAENDDAPWTDRSEIVFISDGRALLVGATTWSGSGEGPYELEVTSTAPLGEPEPEPEPEPVEEEPEVEAPTFAELLPLTEIVPEALGIVADRLGLSWSVTSSQDGETTTRGLQQVSW